MKPPLDPESTAWILYRPLAARLQRSAQRTGGTDARGAGEAAAGGVRWVSDARAVTTQCEAPQLRPFIY